MRLYVYDRTAKYARGPYLSRIWYTGTPSRIGFRGESPIFPFIYAKDPASKKEIRISPKDFQNRPFIFSQNTTGTWETYFVANRPEDIGGTLDLGCPTDPGLAEWRATHLPDPPSGFFETVESIRNIPITDHTVSTPILFTEMVQRQLLASPRSGVDLTMTTGLAKWSDEELDSVWTKRFGKESIT